MQREHRGRSPQDPQHGLAPAVGRPSPSPSELGDRIDIAPPRRPASVDDEAISSRGSEGEEEALEGYLIDIACIRKAPVAELSSRAANHPTSCGLMGHCIESGYGLVDGEGRINLLEPQATTHIVRHLLDTDVDHGIKLRVTRRREGEEMQTIAVQPPASH